MEPGKENKRGQSSMKKLEMGWYVLMNVFKARLKLQSPEMTCLVEYGCDHKSKSNATTRTREEPRATSELP